MTDKMKIAVAGVSGRMGQMLVETLSSSETAQLVAATERPGHDWVGQDVGQMLRGLPSGVTVTDDIQKACAAADAIIDFTAPIATVALAPVAAQAGTAHVIGTTGMTDADIATLAAIYVGGA